MSTGYNLFNEAERLRTTMRVEEAIRFYNLAEANGYDSDLCGAARWTCYMLAGLWQQAWLESDAIAGRGNADPHRYWQGTDWSGRVVLIRCLHGLGDTLQFIRFAPLIRRNARRVIIEAQPKLKPLLLQSGLADEVTTWGEPEPDWQVQMEVNELPRIFRITAETIPANVPYLRASAKRAAPTGGTPLRVGVVWAASDFDTSRNIPIKTLQPLLDLPDISFLSLQAGEGWTDSMPSGLVCWSQRNTSICEIADAIVDLDLVLTVDTMNAHLAGALGQRTWTLLPFQCDWRWMAGRHHSPWYPQMRLFRQPAPGDWDSVVEQVKMALLTWRDRLNSQPAE